MARSSLLTCIELVHSRPRCVNRAEGAEGKKQGKVSILVRLARIGNWSLTLTAVREDRRWFDKARRDDLLLFARESSDAGLFAGFLWKIAALPCRLDSRLLVLRTKWLGSE